MKKLVRDMLVIAMLGAVSVGAFAQKQDQDKRPPKEKTAVVTNSNKDRPQQNNNQPKQDPKKKP